MYIPWSFCKSGGSTCTAITVGALWLTCLLIFPIQGFCMHEAAVQFLRKEVVIPSGNCSVIAFSADSKLVATSGLTRRVDIWDAASGARVRQLDWKDQIFCGTGTSSAESLAFSPNGKWLAGVTSIHHVTIWDLVQGTVHYSFPLYPQRSPILDSNSHSLTFSPDSKYLAIPAQDPFHDGEPAEIRVYDLENGKLLFARSSCDGGASQVAFGNNGKTVLLATSVAPKLGNNDGRFKLDINEWRFPEGSEVLTSRRTFWDFHNNSDCAFSNDGSQFVMTQVKDTEKFIAYIVCQTLNKATHRFAIGDDDIDGVSISPSGKEVATAAKAMVKVWDSQTGKLTGVLDADRGTVGCWNPLFSPDGKWLASFHYNGHEDVLILSRLGNK